MSRGSAHGGMTTSVSSQALTNGLDESSVVESQNSFSSQSHTLNTLPTQSSKIVSKHSSSSRNARNIFDKLEQVPEIPEVPSSGSSVTNESIRRIQEETHRVKDKLRKARSNEEGSGEAGVSMETILQASSSFGSQIGRIDSIRSMEQAGVWGGTIVSVAETPKTEPSIPYLQQNQSEETNNGEDCLLLSLIHI